MSQLGIDIVAADYDVRVIRASGELDVYTAIQLKRELEELFRTCHFRLVLDSEKLDYLDSTGLGVLIGTLKITRDKGGDLRLAIDKPEIHRIFAVTGLDKIFTIYRTVEEAVQTFAPPPATP